MWLRNFNTGPSELLFFETISFAARSVPFTVLFESGQNERLESGDPADLVAVTADLNEQFKAPGGIIGFSLDFRQIDC